MATVLPFPTASRRTEQARDRKPVRLQMTARGRALLTVLAFAAGALVALAAVLLLGTPFAAAGAAEEPLTVTVQSGDTLWGYAEQFRPEGESTEEFVHEMRLLNSLPTGRLTEGQQIVLPEDARLGS